MDWSSTQYRKFEDERTRPARDLLAGIGLAEAKSAVDLGCGPGNSTELLVERFPGAEIFGLDSSPDMIEAARKRLPAIRFEQGKIEEWQPAAPPTVVYSNATLQWLSDHAALFPRLLGFVAPGGSLAIQMPDNLNEPSHALMREAAASGPWAAKLAEASASREKIMSASQYYGLLKPLAARVDIWRTTYHHPLQGGVDGIVEWLKATGLRPYLNPLSDEEREGFLAAYKEELAKAYPLLPDGTVLLPFPRLFIVAQR